MEEVIEKKVLVFTRPVVDITVLGIDERLRSELGFVEGTTAIWGREDLVNRINHPALKGEVC